MPEKLLLFVGAPLSDSLDWSPSGLLDYFTDPIASFTGLPGRPAGREQGSHSPDGPDRTLWRSVPLKRKHLSTGFSQQSYMGLKFYTRGNSRRDTNFFTTADASLDDDGSFSSLILTRSGGCHHEDSVLSQFCEHSIAAHDKIPSSELDVISSQEASSLATDETTSFISGSSRNASFAGEEAVAPPPHLGGATATHLTDLNDLPSAACLTSIEPQTVTVHIIVGIISILPERTVRTRWGGTRSLVEVLVGDETRSGFGITFWLPPAEGKSPLEGFRPQDIVLMRNVALGSFMHKVYGQGLRRDLTKVHLLHRRKLDADDEGGYYSTRDLLCASSRSSSPGSSSSHNNNNNFASESSRYKHPQLVKTARVRDWVVRFVGAGPTAASSRKRTRQSDGRRWDMPPPDTQ